MRIFLLKVQTFNLFSQIGILDRICHHNLAFISYILYRRFQIRHFSSHPDLSKFWLEGLETWYPQVTILSNLVRHNFVVSLFHFVQSLTNFELNLVPRYWQIPLEGDGTEDILPLSLNSWLNSYHNFFLFCPIFTPNPEFGFNLFPSYPWINFSPREEGLGNSNPRNARVWKMMLGPLKLLKLHSMSSLRSYIT